MARPHLFEDQFFAGHDLAPFDGRPTVLVLASTPRSGSSLVGHLLHATGCFGYPLEYLNPANLAEWRTRLDTRDTGDTLRQLVRRRTSENGVFAVKVHHSHLQACRDRWVVDLLAGARFALVRRRDALAQAVSYARAVQTGVWIEGQPPVGDADYDGQLIDRCLERVTRDTAAWARTVAQLGAPHIELTYEDVLADLGGTVDRVADLMDVPRDSYTAPDEPPISAQDRSDAAGWMRQYRSEHGSPRDAFRAPDLGLRDRVVGLARRWRAGLGG